MKDSSATVLLVGENVRACPEVLDWLWSRGCSFTCSETYRQASDRLSKEKFDLILSEYQLPDRTAFPLLDLVAGTSSTLFFSRALDDDFLWLQMIRCGERRNCSEVLRSEGLATALDEFLVELDHSRETEKLAEEIAASPFARLAVS